MKTIQYLEAEDTIQPGDFLRPLDLIYEGQSDYLATSNTYSGKPMNHTRWLQVERAGIDHWIGNTVGEFNGMSESLGRHDTECTRYEFVRGDLPVDSILPETDNEREEREADEIAECILKVGKYKGQTGAQVKRADPSYFEWAVREGILKAK